jgi:site-specific DNA recombinase
LNRPQLTALRELIRTGGVQAVVVYDLDRLARKLAHQLLLTDECDRHGVGMHVASMPLSDKSPEAQLLANMKGAVAEYERLKIHERTRRGLRGRAQAGFASGGNVPLGYIYQPDERHGAFYVIEPEGAAVVQRIFTMYVQDRLPTHAIAKRLTAERVLTQRDRRQRGPARTLSAGTWQPSSIFLILRNRTYTGVLHYGKTENAHTQNNPDRKTTHRAKPQEEWVSIPVPQIIDQATFDAAQLRRQHNTRASRRNRQREYLLSGARLRCGHCGATMAGQCRSNGHRFYRCSRAPFQQTERHQRTINAEGIEDAVWQAVARVLQDPALIAQEAQRRVEEAATQEGAMVRERDGFSRQLVQCEKELKKWEDAYIADVLTLDGFKAKQAEIAVRRATIEQDLDRLAAQQRALDAAVQEMASLTTYCKRVRANLSSFVMDEKRLAIEALNITVTWHPDTPLDIQGVIPVDFVHSTSRYAASLARHRPTAQSRARLWHG